MKAMLLFMIATIIIVFICIYVGGYFFIKNGPEILLEKDKSVSIHWACLTGILYCCGIIAVLLVLSLAFQHIKIKF